MKGDAKKEEKKEKCVSRIRGSISRALQQKGNATIIDEKVFNECLNEIARALLQADVQFKLVHDLQTNIKKIVNFDHLAAGLNKRKIIQQIRTPPISVRHRSRIVFYFDGSSKTTTCTKYAYYHQKNGWKSALVCADTFRAGAFDQLKQNATKAEIPFYGSFAVIKYKEIVIDAALTSEVDAMVEEAKDKIAQVKSEKKKCRWIETSLWMQRID
ncbi:hypothetical protein RHSIM_RhsimUnG0193900 [Rhododendron simsii]|uniref:SRP54-type proteins GTP-binding domain-containing protein n=1 Tax=Rhododendron simsii TaxID=118357 RepID=A0A834FUB1_RHOSS|nr:hypothetical protein RHSIM_RhsimUnG0193900 [Rhododendron simsii]